MGKINHDLRSVDGKTIYQPPEYGGASGQGNLALPNVFQEDEVAQYPIGTRYVNGERVYHYYKAGDTILRTLSSLVSNQAMLNTAVNTNGAVLAGVSKIKIDGTSTGVPAANFYAGGYMLIIGASYYNRITIRIVSSLRAELTPSPYAVELTLEQPLPFDVGDDTSVEIFPNRYSSCITCFGGSGIDGTAWTQVGVPARKMTSGFYGWVQTWGPAPLSYTGTDPSTPGNRMVCFASDGCIAPVGDWWGASTPTSMQMAGYCIGPNSTGGLWIYLMIDP